MIQILVAAVLCLIAQRVPAASAADDGEPRLASVPAAQSAMKGVSAERAKSTVDRLSAFETRHTLSDTAHPTRGIGAARAWVKAALEGAGPRMQVMFEEFEAPASARMPKGGKIVNVVGVLPGRTAESGARAVEIVAHLDSRASDVTDATVDAPGANDNASGCAVVLEAAYALAQAEPLDATVVFLLTAGEEQSLLGARFHVENSRILKDYEVFAVLNNDIVGDPNAPPGSGMKDEPGIVRVFSEGLPRNPSAEVTAKIRLLASEWDSPGRQLARYVDEVAAREGTAVRPRLVFRLDRFLRGGDHIPFVERGVPAVRLTAPNEDYSKQHADVRDVTGPDGRVSKIGDLPEFVSAEYVAGVARLNVAALVHLANAPKEPGNVRMITSRLENGTTLRWSLGDEKSVAGYEVVWRDTTAAQWQRVKDVGKVGEVSLQVSKDDHFFGVRAYNAAGYRSVTVFAGAERE